MECLFFLWFYMLIDDVLGPIGETFGQITGSDAIIGILVFLFFFIFTMLLGLGMLVGSTVIIPAMFVVFKFIPSFAIIVALILGIIFGLGLNRIIKG